MVIKKITKGNTQKGNEIKPRMRMHSNRLVRKKRTVVHKRKKKKIFLMAEEENTEKDDIRSCYVTLIIISCN